MFAAMKDRAGSLDDWRLGVDVGGTFTDAVLIDGHGRQYTRKVPSAPDPSDGLLRVIDQVMMDEGVAPGHALMVKHGTTVATNALIQAQTARAALIVTAGFRDILEIGFQVWPRLFDLFAIVPPDGRLTTHAIASRLGNLRRERPRCRVKVPLELRERALLFKSR